MAKFTKLIYNLIGDMMIVKEVKFVNNKIEIVLDDRSIFISKENYIENPITIDSFIGQDKIDFLLMQEKYKDTKTAIIKQLNKKSFSEYEVYKKIKESGLDKEYIEKIVCSLKRMGLINDEYTAEIFVSSLIGKRKGKIEIIKLLKERGISGEIINKVIGEIDEEE